jgi:transposase-like protein
MTIQDGMAGRLRRTRSSEFKAQVVAACIHPGISIAAVAMANGINANLARSWVMVKQSGDEDTQDDRDWTFELHCQQESEELCFVPDLAKRDDTG